LAHIAGGAVRDTVAGPTIAAAAAAWLAGFPRDEAGEGAQGTFNGISKTTDGGRHRAVVHQESNQPAKNKTNSWIEARMTNGGRDVFFDTP
jgi:hypothetical protein